MKATAITLIDPVLRDTTGHQLGYLLAVGKELRARGVQVDTMLPADTAPAAIEQLAEAGLAPAATLPSMRAIDTTRAATLRWLGQSGQTWRGGLRTDKSRELWFINAEPNLMGGIALTAARNEEPVLAHLFRWFDADGPLRTDRALFAGGVAAACRLLAERGKLALLGQTAPIASHLQEMTGISAVTVGPMVVSWPEAAPEIAARQRTGPPRVGFLGQARSEKGFYLLAEALQLLKEPHQVELHASPAPGEPVERWQAAMDRLQARGATLYRGPLSAADYWALLERLDVVALPYDPVRHAHRTSNILTEAIGAGALPVVPAEGWLGGVGGQHGAETFTPWNAAALAAAIDRALRRAATAPATSSAGSQQAWRHLHSAAGFVDAALAAREAALARKAGRLSRP
ncbi:MAG: hypothetical protein HQ461_15645 [Deltaproteobacteria bacterium]|nr:hypothetical protein [Deltaproteobacteria bacterium]